MTPLAVSYTRSLLLAAIFASSLFGAIQDITVPLDNGSVIIHNTKFGGGDKLYSVGKQLVLSFVLQNHTSSSWNNVDLEFKIGGFCNLEAQEWSYVVHGGYLPSGATSSIQFQEIVGPLPGKNMDCSAEIIKAKLVFATACANPTCLGNSMRRIEGSKEPLDIETEFQTMRAKRAADIEEQKVRDTAETERLRQAAVEAERLRQDNAAQAAKEEQRTAAGEAELQKKLAAERRKSQAEYAKRKGEEDARLAAERTRIRAACSLIYKNTADKKIGDLTVREEQQVRACQLIGLYPPR